MTDSGPSVRELLAYDAQADSLIAGWEDGHLC